MVIRSEAIRTNLFKIYDLLALRNSSHYGSAECFLEIDTQMWGRGNEHNFVVACFVKTKICFNCWHFFAHNYLFACFRFVFEFRMKCMLLACTFN